VDRRYDNTNCRLYLAPASEATVIQYLNGEGKDLDKAMELLQFFRERIETRRKILQA
jgi:hypothetical protein